MTQEAHQEIAGKAAGIAPPTVRGEVAVVRTWPRVIGILSITMAALGMLHHLWAAAGQVFMTYGMPRFASAGSGQEMDAILSVMREWMPAQLAIAGTGLLVSGLLLAAGIGVLRERRWGVRAMHVWAAMRIALGVGQALATVGQHRDQLAAMAESDPSMAGAMSAAGSSGFTAAQFVLVLGWAAILPVFMLVWFGLKEIKGQTRSWT